MGKTKAIRTDKKVEKVARMLIPNMPLPRSFGIMSGIAFCLVVSSTAPFAASGEKIGSAVSIVNTVTGNYAKQKRGLAAGDNVRQDELVEVSADSLGEFRLDDDTKLALGPGARLLLDKFVYDSDKKAGSIVVNLVKGTFRFMTGLATKSTYVVRTPTAAITVRGTIFDVFILPDNSTWLLLHEGAIEVRGAGNVCRVLDRPGHVMRVTSTGSVGVPINWQRLPGRTFPFDTAFPFVGRPPQIDPTPQLTRLAIVDAANVEQRAQACTTLAPVVPGMRRASSPPPRPRDRLRKSNRDRDVEVVRAKPGRVVNEKPARVVKKSPPKRPPQRPGRRTEADGFPIGIAIGIGIGGFRPGGRGMGPRSPMPQMPRGRFSR